MCEEESDDSEAVAKLLEINDSIHRTVERYKLVKKGDVEAASKIPKGTLGTSTGVGKNAANELSLIDFEPEPSANGATASTFSEHAKPTTVEDDLLGLSMDDKPFGQSGGIALGYGTSAGTLGPGLPLSTGPQGGGSRFNPIKPPSPAPTPHTTRPKHNAFSLSTSQSPSKPPTPTPVVQQQKQSGHKPLASNDPFASLVSPSPRTRSPLSKPNITPCIAPTPSLLDLVDTSGTSDPLSVPSKNVSSTDEEWSFTSSLPETAVPTSHRLQVLSSYVVIDFNATRPPGQSTIHITVQFSNATQQSISGLHFQVAVEKVKYSNL